MASTAADRGEEGFATSAATLISLALAIIAVAVTAAAIARLKAARADFQRARSENLLAGAQQSALLAVVAGGPAGRFRWTVFTDQGQVRALAEPEAAKASLASLVMLDDAAFARFGVADPRGLKGRLAQLSVAEAISGGIEAADPSLTWRSCSRSFVSAFGAGAELGVQPAKEPALATAVARTGEVWRVRVRDAAGWVDDRVVRFTGDGTNPAAVVERRFEKLNDEGVQCDSLFAGRG